MPRKTAKQELHEVRQGNKMARRIVALAPCIDNNTVLQARVKGFPGMLECVDEDLAAELAALPDGEPYHVIFLWSVCICKEGDTWELEASSYQDILGKDGKPIVNFRPYKLAGPIKTPPGEERVSQAYQDAEEELERETQQ